jgi:quinoprotein glucose dehydrogenase
VTAPAPLGDRLAGAFRWAVIAGVGLTGLALAAGGLRLGLLGGSLYYVAAGLGLCAACGLLARRSSAGLWLYGVVFCGTAAWSILEVGFRPWALMPRLVFLAILGLCVASPPVSRLRPVEPAARRLFLGLLAVTAAAFAAASWSRVEARPAGALWSDAVLGAPSGPQEPPEALRRDHYSAAREITPANVAGLERAWVFRPGARNPDGHRSGGLEVTPILADGVLYGCTAFDSVFALDPVTGAQIWRRDAGVPDEDGGHPVCRGVAFFRAPPGVRDCPTRLIFGTLSNQLVALDAKTGAPCRGFGQDGRVDLRKGMGPFPRRWAHPTSPPTIVRGVAVIGAYVVDNQSAAAPSGVVRGYDAVTGAFRWAFDPGRPDEAGEPAPGGRYTPGTPNAWTLASGDEALGLVYVPMGNGSPDLYGGQRSPQTDRFSSALVALDANTGRPRWVFQTVHHDLWDYDLASAPSLVDLPSPEGTVPALVLATKTGQLFLLDRRIGRPLSAVAERPVPRSDVPGERAAATQPFSVGMPDFAGPRLVEADMWGLTPFDQLWCRIQFRKARYLGIYTPPRLGKTIRYPGELGGIDWGGLALDPGRGLLIVNSNRMADLDELVTRAEADREGLVPKTDAAIHSAAGGPMAGTPYAIHWGPFLSPLGVPCQRPPYGLLTAVDLRTRSIVWRHPLGDARNSGPFGVGLGLPIPLGAPNIGGALVTGGGLVFIAATQDEMFRAVDERTGRVLWQDRLPVGGHATPMGYIGSDGRQYVVIAAGGGALKDKPGDFIVAYRLGEARTSP